MGVGFLNRGFSENSLRQKCRSAKRFRFEPVPQPETGLGLRPFAKLAIWVSAEGVVFIWCGYFIMEHLVPEYFSLGNFTLNFLYSKLNFSCRESLWLVGHTSRLFLYCPSCLNALPSLSWLST